jgi:hypothetical protein
MVRPLGKGLLIWAVVLAVTSGCDDGTQAIERRCATAIGSGMLGAIDAVTGAPQIHPWAEFDGENIWVAYTGADDVDPNVFDTWVLRLGCDGASSSGGEPQRVTTTTGRNEIDPVLSVGKDSVMVAWISDNGTGVDNIDTVVRAYDFDGAPLTGGDLTLETELGGQAVTGNAWDPALAPLPDGQFFLAGSRVAPGAPTFRVYGQRLEADGSPTGESFELDEPGPETHGDVSVTAGRSGDAWVSWSILASEGDTALSARIAAGAEEATGRAPLMTAASASRNASVRIDDDLSIAALSATVGGESDIALVAEVGGARHEATLGDPGALDHSAIVATEDAGSGAVAYWRNLGGLSNQLVLRGFAVDAGGIRLGAPIEIAHAIPAPPYPPAITHVSGGVYFVAWAEGDNPEFYLQGALLDLSVD